MARVTVEDCLKNVDNRFDLVLLSTRRARDLLNTGVDPYVPWDNDKATVVALREIAEGYIKSDYISPQVVEAKAEPLTYEFSDFEMEDESDNALIKALTQSNQENEAEISELEKGIAENLDDPSENSE